MFKQAKRVHILLPTVESWGQSFWSNQSDRARGLEFSASLSRPFCPASSLAVENLNGGTYLPWLAFIIGTCHEVSCRQCAKHRASLGMWRGPRRGFGSVFGKSRNETWLLSNREWWGQWHSSIKHPAAPGQPQCVSEVFLSRMELAEVALGLVASILVWNHPSSLPQMLVWVKKKFLSSLQS